MFNDFLDALDDDVFEDVPVDLKTFMYDSDWLKLPGHSPVQEDIIDRCSQLYHYDTLKQLWGKEEADRIESRRTIENYLILGKSCVSADSMIFNPDDGKFHRIDSLLDEGNVLGPDEIEYRTGAEKLGNGKVYRIRTELGFTEDVYENHLFYSFMGEPKLTKDLRVGDTIELSTCSTGDNQPEPNDDLYRMTKLDYVPEKVWQWSPNWVRYFLYLKYDINPIFSNDHIDLGKDVELVKLLGLKAGYFIGTKGSRVTQVIDEISGFYSDKIVSIKYIGEQDYWAFEVPGSGFYCGNGIIHSNSGKNSMSQVIFLYVIYQLLCLKDPATYLGKISGDNIDIVNLALNARSASNTFFKTFLTRLKKIKWFAGKYHPRANDVQFDKNVTLHSLNSEGSSAEGYNLFLYLVDEIAEMTLEKALEVANALNATVTSRFPRNGKGIYLSFSRSKNDFMMNKWDDIVLDKDASKHEHTFKLNREAPDGIEGNEFTIEWIEEEAKGYKYSGVFAMKMPTWKVNPTVSIDDFTNDFYRNPEDSLMRYASNPPEHESRAFFKNHTKLEEAFCTENGWNGDYIAAREKPDTSYYVHIDLSKFHDRTVVAMGHVSEWVEYQIGDSSTVEPIVNIDLYRIWEPTRANPVDHAEVARFVLDLARKFNIVKVTFDQWGSANMIEELRNVGIDASKHSLARAEYQEFAILIGEGRIKGPHSTRLMEELTGLIIRSDGKVDHKYKGHNDITEGIVGVIWSCVENERGDGGYVEVYTPGDLYKKKDNQQTSKTPESLLSWLDNIGVL